MFSKMQMKESIGNFSQEIDFLKRKINDADAIVVGAGSGLSSAAGFTYSGERFRKYFSDFQDKYGFDDRYIGGFYPFPTIEEYWAYWSRFIYINRYRDPPKPVYGELLSLVKDKDYFVITTNVDHCFQKAGFDKTRLFYTQGDYGLFQCSRPCHNETYDNKEVILKRVKEQKGRKSPSDLIPYCPHCHSLRTRNLRCDSSFVEDKGWKSANGRYEDFLFRHEGEKVLFLELGVGRNTPVIIKYPFRRRTRENHNAFYVSVSRDENFIPDRIKSRSLSIKADIGKVLGSLCQTNSGQFSRKPEPNRF